ncbi:MAG: hydrogenase iron-sulfur subunit [Candidatus Eisenbacteria bacterium]|nr:hydrogenase iron-sulfur subunit [Candidatus Eisenbacteria bacterium]
MKKNASTYESSMRETPKRARADASAPGTAGAGAPAYDPRVLVFACNWCSYAGADTAGVARLPQSPHFRLLRVMCSGRVHPSHVLRAFARGADGVMVSGCHFGDCHYLFGNHRAAEQFERTRALVALLGLEPERLRLEWISAAEGVRFAETMNEFVEAVRRLGPSRLAPSTATHTQASTALEGTRASDGAGASSAERGAFEPARNANLAGCLECGRCTAVCPVARFQRFSPRRLVTRAFAGGMSALANDPALWACLTCLGCAESCPVRVDYPRFILSARAAMPGRLRDDAEAPPDLPGPDDAARAKTRESGLVPCSHGGVFHEVSVLTSRASIRQQRLGWLDARHQVEILDDGAQAQSPDLFFAGCSPYFAAYFGGETEAGLVSSLASAMRLLNRASVRPAVLANERCCGHHLRLAGQAEEAAILERAVVEQVAASGVKRVIAFCPECLVSLRETFAVAGLRCTVVHVSEALDHESSPDPARAIGRVTYQDPCRLGRGSGVYEPPRRLLAQAGAELREMAHAREAAICCGNSGWLNCNAATQQFQAARLAEAARTGSERLVTACPGCFVHLRCAQQGLPEGQSRIEIVDLWSLLDRAGERQPGGASALCEAAAERTERG